MQISLCRKFVTAGIVGPKDGETTRHDIDAPHRSAAREDVLVTCGNRLGGVMRIRRSVIIPAILALGATGSILAAPAVSATVAQAPAVHAHVVAEPVATGIYYHL